MPSFLKRGTGLCESKHKTDYIMYKYREKNYIKSEMNSRAFCEDTQLLEHAKFVYVT